MRALVQRVLRAKVTVAGVTVGEVGRGLAVFLGVHKEDTPGAAGYLADKIAHLRVFADAEGKMNRSVMEVAGAALVVSQFTLYGDARKGRRPNYTAAAAPAAAESLYADFCAELGARGVPVATGRFQANMQVELVNDGPVTILLESPTPALKCTSK